MKECHPQGSDLLDPARAQYATVVRTPAFLTKDDIEVIRHSAAHYTATHPDAGFTLYLQHKGLDPALADIVARVHDRVNSIDAEHWALNAVHALEGVSGVSAGRHSKSSGGDGGGAATTTANVATSGYESDGESSVASLSYCTDGTMRARTVEFHEYSKLKRQICANHSDWGSLFTADVMLSDTCEFEGGQMITTVTEEGGTSIESVQTFEQGDLLVFPSHKPHSVRQVTAGTRLVFVVEFWRGPTCTCDCRCIGSCADGLECEVGDKRVGLDGAGQDGRTEGLVREEAA